MANSVVPDRTAPIGAVCSGSTLSASILNSSVMLGNYLQQTTLADDIFRCIFSWRFKIYTASATDNPETFRSIKLQKSDNFLVIKLNFSKLDLLSRFEIILPVNDIQHFCFFV